MGGMTMLIALDTLAYLMVGVCVTRALIHFHIPDSNNALYLGWLALLWPLVVTIHAAAGILFVLGGVAKKGAK